MSPDRATRKSRPLQWLIAYEPWLPALAGLAWWVVFYPGFFGEDALMNLAEARNGTVSVGFTAWWIYVVDALTLSARAAPLLTFAGVLGLEYAAYLWVMTVFPAGTARALTVAAMSASPLIGAFGIQIRHDISMTAGLLLIAVVLTRTWARAGNFTPFDYGALLLAAPLVATRHNGMPTVAVAAVLLLGLDVRRWRQPAAVALVAAGAAFVTYGATKASGHTAAVDPIQMMEWVMGDISCVLTKDGVNPTAEEWATLSRVAAPADWPQPRACRVMNPMFRTPSFNPTAIPMNYRELVGVWTSLSARHPVKMASAHAERVRLFLPPFAVGIPDSLVESFLHSTILPNDFGLTWQFPALAARARILVRLWNALSFFLANAALWLIVLVVAAWRLPGYRRLLTPAIVIAMALEIGILATAPISEGRYGMFILISGQATALFWVFKSRDRQISRSPNHS